ncbi:hypothetical protein MPTK1_3g06970 [Marchantia polymorpha subsp. ruderalis]
MLEMGTWWNRMTSRMLWLWVLVSLHCICSVHCGDDDYRVVVTTDIEDGLFVRCLSEDKTIEKLPRKVMPGDLTYSFALDQTSPIFSSYFFCTVSNHEGNTMTFTAFDKKYTEKSWKFPLVDDMREVRWSINHVGAWVYVKGRPRADSIMKWQVDEFWPPWPPVLPPNSNQSGPSNWDELEAQIQIVQLKPRILPPIYIPEFIMKPFDDPLHVLPWYLDRPWT